ncbi:MAG: hypothetical protein M3P29_11945 [Acidobacteriota bacterium]|nr:hypothetical protein [Acidobacteriota bacterium]
MSRRRTLLALIIALPLAAQTTIDTSRIASHIGETFGREARKATITLVDGAPPSSAPLCE